MGDHYSPDCDEPADHDSRDALPPSRMLGSVDVPAGSPAGVWPGFDFNATQQQQTRSFAGLVAASAGEIDPIERDVGEAAALIKSITDKIHSGLSAHLDECQRCIDSCHANICGAHDLVMDWCEAEISKRQAKIDNFLVMKLAQVYNLLARFGVRYETDDVVRERMHGPEPNQWLGDAGVPPQAAQNDRDRKMRPDAMPEGARPGIDAGIGSGNLTPEGSRPRIDAGIGSGNLTPELLRSNLGMTEYPHCLPVRICVDPTPIPPTLSVIPERDPVQQFTSMHMVATGVSDIALQS